MQRAALFVTGAVNCCSLMLISLPASVAKKGHVLGILAGRDGRDAFKAVLHGSNFFKNFSLLPGTHAGRQAGSSNNNTFTTHSHFTDLIVATLTSAYMYMCAKSYETSSVTAAAVCKRCLFVVACTQEPVYNHDNVPGMRISTYIVQMMSLLITEQTRSSS